MSTGMGTPTKKDDFKPTTFIFKEGCRASFVDCHRPAVIPSPSFDSDTNLLPWRQKIDLYLGNIPTDHKRPYILSLLIDNVQDVLWASDLSTTAIAAAIWSKPGEYILSPIIARNHGQLSEVAVSYLERP
ncbi:hypothetical protein EG68_04836 [Paragonimus skrjabini miyazakii]|uniref:Uncharacterized protein n=1 Tax=Paragonimus skrjabini miyazakii TaxID=59628 RepID=A0A8S9YXY7_9TREM|nr:hypothetical protein EG68_04836 [Paragonimus skrjabini miyazakii]